MSHFKKVILTAVNICAFWATSAVARPTLVDWVPNNLQYDGPSCVTTCQRQRAYPAISGYMNVGVIGDRNLYVCRAYAPGFEAYGVRAGYNWTGSSGNSSQPGCMVVSGNGSSLARSFDCLCEFNNHRPIRD